jgi:23S rRNA (cytidine1920-2'-O)/16S rRNA (cytidine1409-2'-O)-methyltransferase
MGHTRLLREIYNELIIPHNLSCYNELMEKHRLDYLLVARGYCESRSLAQRLIMAGQVRVNGELALKGSQKVFEDVDLEILQPPPFVSRGGEKLAAALEAFSVQVKGSVCADVGASTGGFTDCLLQNGASRVYTIDVGKGILHWKIRQDPRVVVMEKTNARFLRCLPEAVHLVTMDVSFISVKILLPVIKNWFLEILDKSSLTGKTRSEARKKDNQALILIKPQFEAGKSEAARGRGIIRDAKIHQRVLYDVLCFAHKQDFSVQGVIRSPIKGPKGNIEFLAWLTYPRFGASTSDRFDIEKDLPQICNLDR